MCSSDLGEQKSRALAVSIRGSFDSFFKGQPPPSPDEEGGESTEQTELQTPIEASPESSRLVVIGSAEFLDDTVLNFSRSLSADRYLLNVQFLHYSAYWLAAADSLLTFRSICTNTTPLQHPD